MMNDWVQNERNGAHSLRFLVVESSLGARILIRAHLLESKHLVDMAWDNESAIELSCMRAYDFILVDRNLNCYELMDHIHKNSVVNEHTPMIILTSIHNENNKSQGSAIYLKNLYLRRMHYSCLIF
ncbi:response regulator [Legionella bozemanae]|uniref:response regulator n=1 Tax=Legionella bozemanae TaxID=447 RepID=UPI003EEC360B